MDRYRSNGLSVQTEIEEIFPPENTRSYTKYTKRKRYTEIMIGCIVLGDENAFPIDFDTGKTIGHLKEAIKNRAELDSPAHKLKLWKVDIPESKKREIYEGIDIEEKFGGVKLDSDLCLISDYFKSQPTLRNIHIIVEKPQPETTVSSMNIISDEVKIEIKNKVVTAFPHINNHSIDQLIDALALIWHVEVLKSGSPGQQNDPYVELKKEPSFFKINLPRGITKKTSKTVDLCLPSYSKSGMDYHNPFYDDPQFKKTVSLVQEKIEENPGDVIVLAGVSGGGKTSTTFGIAMQCWSIYIDFSPKLGTYGDHAGPELHDISNIKPSFEDNDQQSKAFRILDIVILSRVLLLIKMLTEEKIATKKEWLFVQLQMDDSKIRNILTSKNYDTLTIKTLIKDINACLKVEDLTLIFDEAQVLCRQDYGEYKGSSIQGKKWNLLQAYIEHLTHFSVTCLIAGTYMHMASGISLVTSVGKHPNLHTHIVLKLPFLSQDDVLQNLDAVIDLTDVTPKTRDCLGYLLKGRPRNCASFIRHLISKRESNNRTKDQEIQKFLCLWFNGISTDMAEYLENACTYPSANEFSPEVAIMDVLRLRVFYDHKFEHVIKLLQHSIIPCQSPDSIKLSKNSNDSPYNDSYKIKINTSLESYLVSGIEVFLLNRNKTLVGVFVDDIIRLKDISSIGNEFDAVFITAMIQKRGFKVLDELNLWKNGQEFSLPEWITPSMKFITIQNLSGSVPIAEYIGNTTYYGSYGIQPDRFSGSDVVISFVDDEQNVVLLSASCTVSGKPIKRSKIKEQVFKSCMKFQYMEKTKKRKRGISQIDDHEKEFSWKKEECLETGLGQIPANNKEDNSEEEEEEEDDQDFNHDDLNYDLKYIENTKGYHVSRVPKHADNHEKIKSFTENQKYKYIYVSIELPHRASKRPELFRFNEYGDLVIIVDNRNMESVFGEKIKELVERICYKENQENSMDETE